MLPKSISRLNNAALRSTIRTNVHPRSPVSSFSTVRNPISTVIERQGITASLSKPSKCTVRNFHVSPLCNGIMPDSADPAPKESEANEHVTAPTELSHEEYHQRADEYLDLLVNRLEQQQESRQDLEVEYAAGVLEVSIASKGTYVLNKQPPNRQIWLSSPQSGPKRFDWVVTGESMNQKEGSGVGDWIYLRDGISLTDLIRKELGVELGIDTDVA
ncbi:arabinogalactan endo-1,4-beta-galactosidase [Glonium stellatum]|uniref:ferroxidase n=1 Tax=Glonium stellatum TaxID=574774 RepID=A0A8E2F1W6_9PEZI|nr:arabinogalactan endo-1,4-beta-galactosidase [Glonium stellatum]